MSREFGFLRISTAVPRVTVADPTANVSETLRLLGDLTHSDVVVFPELSISSYSCGRLFHQTALLEETEAQIQRLCIEAPSKEQLLLVGAPVRQGTALYNCVVVINDGRVLGVVPKQFVPNYNEFYEARWFATAHDDLPDTVALCGQDVPFGTRLMFTHSAGTVEAVVFAEICEAIWMPIPPSSLASIAGANVLCNLSASPETVGKSDYRRSLVTGQSGRCISAYAYSSSAPTESTADVVFGGHALIAEGGHLVAESSRVGDSNPTQRNSYSITADIDVERLQTERRTTTTFADSDRCLNGASYTRIPFSLAKPVDRGLMARVDALPFVPKDSSSVAQRCAEVFGIQTASLAKRLECLGHQPKLSIGISGGLDSTLALLVAVRTCDLLELPRSVIRGVTMPGFGTTDHTLGNARELMRELGITVTEIDIRQAVFDEYKVLADAMGYRPFGQIDLDSSMTLDGFLSAIDALADDQRRGDLTFENVQARRRTELLMNMGFVLGTGDMSEMWLGWCTYNADHQSMYNVNCSVPKTLVRFLVEYAAAHEFDGDVRRILQSVAATEISPELLPPSRDGGQAQSTEDTVGPYELHDFFMFNLARYGYSPAKVQYLAGFANGWSRSYSSEEIEHWLAINIKRAFSQQYKRDDVPNGPKVGSLSLSPRGDWRMPSDASPQAWLNTIRTTGRTTGSDHSN